MGVKGVNDPVTRSELHDYARQEILRNKNIVDIVSASRSVRHLCPQAKLY